MHLATHFEFTVNRYPNRIALIEQEKIYTYEQLNNAVNRIASSLQNLGLGKQDRVMVLLKNRLETIITFWAVQKLGAIFTPINLRLAQEDIQHCVNDVEAKFIIYEKNTAYLIDEANFPERPIMVCLEEGLGDITFKELQERGTGSFSPVEIKDDDLAVILYTSGTSGKPKGVPRSHKNEYAATMAHIVQCHYKRFENTLGVMPLNHTMGVRSLLSVVLLNGTYVIVTNFDPSECSESVEQHKISSLYMTPTMYHDLIHHKKSDDYDFSHLEVLVYAGAPMKPELIKKCVEVFQPAHFINHYGSTEIYTFTTFSDLSNKPGCAGKPGVHQDIRIFTTLSGQEKYYSASRIPEGMVGEVVVSTKSYEAFKGYWNRPDATRSVIKNDWYHTGDLGYFDEDGDLFIVGRVDEMILSEGENIHPKEVERVLGEHPKVKEVVVKGEEDERLGQLVVAYIVPTEDISPRELDQHCKQYKNLSGIMRPRKYVFVQEIPKTTSGKIMLRKLKFTDYDEEG